MSMVVASTPVAPLNFGSLGSTQRDDQAAAMTKLINYIGMQPQFFRNAVDKLSKSELQALGDAFHSLSASK